MTDKRKRQKLLPWLLENPDGGGLVSPYAARALLSVLVQLDPQIADEVLVGEFERRYTDAASGYVSGGFGSEYPVSIHLRTDESEAQSQGVAFHELIHALDSLYTTAMFGKRQTKYPGMIIGGLETPPVFVPLFSILLR